MRRPKTTALVDPAAARAYRLLDIERKVIDALAPLAPEKRSRVLEAVCILHGLEGLAAEIRATRAGASPVSQPTEHRRRLNRNGRALP